MKAIYTSLLYGVGASLIALVVLDIFGIAEQGSLKIAHRGAIGRKGTNLKQALTDKSAALYQ